MMAFCALSVLKSVKQPFSPNSEQHQMMNIFKDMVNFCIKTGLEHNCHTMKRLSRLSYNQLKEYKILSYYKLNTIFQVAGRLTQMKKDIKKGRKGNGHGTNYRRKLNSWSFYELQRQIQYKAAWEGIPVCFVDPKRTNKLCPICGDRIQEDRQNRRKLLCINCGKSMDCDVVASMNVARKGWARFTHPRGLSDEAMKGNAVYEEPLILRVGGSKLIAGR